MTDATAAQTAFQCNGCGARMRVPAAKAGKSGKCPKCGGIVQIPAAPPTVPSLPPSASPMMTDDGRIKFACDSCGGSLKVPVEAVGRRVKCPKCQTIATVPDPDAGASGAAGEDDMFAGLSVGPAVAARAMPPPPPPPVPDGRPAARGTGARPAARGGGSGFQLPLGMLANPGIIFVGLSVVFGGLFALARSSSDVVPVAMLVFAAFSFGVGIWAVVLGFLESAGTGFMVMCLPFYVLYFVFSKSENPHLKAAFGASIIATGLRVILDFGARAQAI
jgi:predicted RNA-binding Zn-ribbon protein involved in translation (DUF1610 family)